MYQHRSNMTITIEANVDTGAPEQMLHRDGVTYADWLISAERTCFESHVPLRHIRLHSEHVDIAALHPNQMSHDKEGHSQVCI